MNRIYWPELDGLRFYAFFLVFISHLGHISGSTESKIINLYNLIVDWGWIGVEIFFALSGFLISYIISAEIQQFHSFDLKRFYIRRALRIWPLYYLIFVCGFFLLPLFGWLGISIFSSTWIGYLKWYFLPFLLFLGNFPIAILQGSISPAFGILWTVCIEEQYYLCIGLIRKYTGTARIVYGILFALLVLSIITRTVLFYYSKTHLPYYYNTLAHLDGLLIGSAAGIFYQRYSSLTAKLSKWLVGPMSILFVAMIGYTPTIFVHDPSIIYVFTFLGLYFSTGIIFLLNIKSNVKSIVLLNKRLVYLGRISYGLYVYHMFSIVSVKTIFSQYALAAIASFILTIMLSYISYNYFETRFLKRKREHERITTREGPELAEAEPA